MFQHGVVVLPGRYFIDLLDTCHMLNIECDIFSVLDSEFMISYFISLTQRGDNNPVEYLIATHASPCLSVINIGKKCLLC